MLLLLSGATKEIPKFAYHPNFGILLVPRDGNSLDPIIHYNLPFALDNGAFSNFDEKLFFNLVDRIQGLNPLFVTCPDKVEDAKETCKMFEKYRSRIRFPLGFVAQDNLELSMVPWDQFYCLFIGGSTFFKLSVFTFNLIKEAKRRGKWVHVGRVNGIRRIRYFKQLNIDSFDGSGYSKFPYKIEQHLSYIS